jgi:hypothetical protein
MYLVNFYGTNNVSVWRVWSSFYAMIVARHVTLHVSAADITHVQPLPKIFMLTIITERFVLYKWLVNWFVCLQTLFTLQTVNREFVTKCMYCQMQCT